MLNTNTVAPLRSQVGYYGLAALIAFGLALLASAFNAPLWVLGLAATVPFIPLFTGLTLDTRRAAGSWLALFLVLAVTQTAHVGEHVAQVAELRLLGIPAEHAHGIFGALDVEWVHFAWNAWVVVAISVLLFTRARSPWLWAAGIIGGWHLFEHAVLIVLYVATGVEGRPGLLADGGLIAGGLPIARPEMHLLYNLVETLPLIIGFALAWRAWRRVPVSTLA